MDRATGCEGFLPTFLWYFRPVSGYYHGGGAVKTEGICVGGVTGPQFVTESVVRNTAQKGRRTWLRFASYAGLMSFFLSLTAFNLVDVDIWHEMALIRESLRAGHLLTRDVLAYTPTLYPCIHHER